MQSVSSLVDAECTIVDAECVIISWYRVHIS
jgi:hypothetical protein